VLRAARRERLRVAEGGQRTTVSPAGSVPATRSTASRVQPANLHGLGHAARERPFLAYRVERTFFPGLGPGNPPTWSDHNSIFFCPVPFCCSPTAPGTGLPQADAALAATPLP